MKFHIACTGRSGSVYAHRLINQLGLRSLHEKVSERPFKGRSLSYVEKNPKVFQLYDGTVGWRWDIGCPKLVAAAEHKFFMTRDPLSFLPSAVTHDDGVFDAVERAIGRKYIDKRLSGAPLKVSRAANYWLGYIDHFSSQRHHLFVEAFRLGGKSLKLFADVIGLPEAVLVLAEDMKTDVNSRRTLEAYMPDAPEILQRTAPQVFDALLAARSELGYGNEIGSIRP